MQFENIKTKVNDLYKDVVKHLARKKNYDKGDQQHQMTEDEKIDEEIEESFPASDPPGHFSKSSEDKILHE